MALHRTLLYEKIVGAYESVVASKAIIVTEPLTAPEQGPRVRFPLGIVFVLTPEYGESASA